jgi:hypothetical protein
MILAFATPYLPFPGVFAFVPLPGALLATIAVIVLTYAAATERHKKWFYPAVNYALRELIRTS